MRRSIIATVILLVVLAGAIFSLVRFSTTPSQLELGVTFSTVYSYGLGLDPKETYLALLDDLQVKKVRLPIYWSEIETKDNEFDWELTDFLVSEAAKRNAELVLVIGRKVPRWPECYVPDWAEGLTGAEANQAVLDMEKMVIEHYKDNSAVVGWQVENEPFFPFGVCPSPDLELLSQEHALVRSLDSKPIISTVSGEMDPWFPIPHYTDYDVTGVSLYRVSFNSWLGLFPYPLNPFIYRLHSLAATTFWHKKIIVSELQAEPWFDKLISELTDSERATAFTSKDLQNNVNFAAQAGFSEAYLWGAEWWYLEKEAGRPELWEAAKELFK